MYNGVNVDIIAAGGETIDESKYSTSKNTSTGLYYRLHILNVGVSDLRKHRCEAAVNGEIKTFFLQLILRGRCYYIMVIFKCKTERVVWSGQYTMVVVGIK